MFEYNRKLTRNIKGVNYLLNLPYHIIDYDFTYIPWYNLSTWVNE
jgi:hypothetical protein